MYFIFFFSNSRSIPSAADFLPPQNSLETYIINQIEALKWHNIINGVITSDVKTEKKDEKDDKNEEKEESQEIIDARNKLNQEMAKKIIYEQINAAIAIHKDIVVKLEEQLKFLHI